jgi:hypothetical protein
MIKLINFIKVFIFGIVCQMTILFLLSIIISLISYLQINDKNITKIYTYKDYKSKIFIEREPYTYVKVNYDKNGHPYSEVYFSIFGDIISHHRKGNEFSGLHIPISIFCLILCFLLSIIVISNNKTNFKQQKVVDKLVEYLKLKNDRNIKSEFIIGAISFSCLFMLFFRLFIFMYFTLSSELPFIKVNSDNLVIQTSLSNKSRKTIKFNGKIEKVILSLNKKYLATYDKKSNDKDFSENDLNTVTANSLSIVDTNNLVSINNFYLTDYNEEHFINYGEWTFDGYFYFRTVNSLNKFQYYCYNSESNSFNLIDK